MLDFDLITTPAVLKELSFYAAVMFFSWVAGIYSHMCWVGVKRVLRRKPNK